MTSIICKTTTGAKLVLFELGKIGFEKNVARKLLEKYGHLKVEEQIRHYRAVISKGSVITNPVGWLTIAVEQNFQYASAVTKNKADSTCPKCQGEGYYPTDDNLSSMIICDCRERV